ncbi:hypothetical protein Y032_0398g712, partial [Ancylostoma ceylanicum]
DVVDKSLEDSDTTLPKLANADNQFHWLQTYDKSIKRGLLECLRKRLLESEQTEENDNSSTSFVTIYKQISSSFCPSILTQVYLYFIGFFEGESKCARSLKFVSICIELGSNAAVRAWDAVNIYRRKCSITCSHSPMLSLKNHFWRYVSHSCRLRFDDVNAILKAPVEAVTRGSVQYHGNSRSIAAVGGVTAYIRRRQQSAWHSSDVRLPRAVCSRIDLLARIGEQCNLSGMATSSGAVRGLSVAAAVLVTDPQTSVTLTLLCRYSNDQFPGNIVIVD